MSKINVNFFQVDTHGFAIYRAALKGERIFDLHVRQEEGKEKHRVFVSLPDHEVLLGTKGFVKMKGERFSTDYMRHLVARNGESVLVQLLKGEDFDGWYPTAVEEPADVEDEDEDEDDSDSDDDN